MSTGIDALRAKLSLLKEMGVAEYHLEKGAERIRFFQPAPILKTLSPKEQDDAEREQAARLEEWEKRIAMGASGGIRTRMPRPVDQAGAGSVNPTLNAAVRRERAAQQTKGAA